MSMSQMPVEIMKKHRCFRHGGLLVIFAFIFMVSSQAQILQKQNAGSSLNDTPTTLSIVLAKLRNAAIKALNDRGYTDLAEVTVAQDKPLGRWGKLASSDAGSNIESGSSLVTLELPPEPLAELVNVMDLYRSLFGITPDFSDVNDTVTFNRKVKEIILTSSPSFSLDCQPSFRVWPEEINAGFVDQNSAAHIMIFPAFGPNDLVMIEGSFPAARYFSFQTYDGNFSPVGFLRDAHIHPLGTGRNPYSTLPPDGTEEGAGEEAREEGRYRLYLTKDGKRGFRNELGVAKSNFSLGGLVLVIFRIYGVDPSAHATDPGLAPWGFVPPIQVRSKLLGTVSQTATDIIWQTFPRCPLNNTLIVRDALTALTNLVNMADVTQRACPSENIPNNFMYYQAQRPSLPGLGLGLVPPAPSLTPFPNQDASFLLACASNRAHYVKGNDLVVLARGYLPRTPGGFDQPPLVADVSSYHVRYASFSVYDLNLPGPLLRSVSDDEFRAFYRILYGNDTWEISYGRNVSLVVVRNRAVLDRCKLDTSESFVVELDQHEPVSDWFGVVYREILPQRLAADTDSQAASLLRSKAGGAVYDESIFDAKQAVCATGQDEGVCDPNPHRVAQTMKMHTPRSDYFMCSPSGIVLVAPPATPDPFSDAGYPALEDRAWDDGTGEKVLPEDAQACAHPTSGEIEGIVRVYSPCAWIHVHVAGQPVKVVPPGQVGVRKVPVSALSTGPVVVCLSVKANTADEAPFIAEVDLCGNTFISDQHWRCSNEPPIDDTWLLPTFQEGPEWKAATRAQCVDCRRGPLPFTSTMSTRTARAPHLFDLSTMDARGIGRPIYKPTHRDGNLRYFSKDGRKFIQPSPLLDEEAKEAWQNWKQAKEDANNAWRAWRLAKEQHRNRTANSNSTLDSIPPGVQHMATNLSTPGGISTVNATVRSPDWRDFSNMSSAVDATLRWSKPRPTQIHGYYCRLVFPNPLGDNERQAGRGAVGV